MLQQQNHFTEQFENHFLLPESPLFPGGKIHRSNETSAELLKCYLLCIQTSVLLLFQGRCYRALTPPLHYIILQQRRQRNICKLPSHNSFLSYTRYQLSEFKIQKTFRWLRVKDFEWIKKNTKKSKIHHLN